MKAAVLKAYNAPEIAEFQEPAPKDGLKMVDMLVAGLKPARRDGHHEWHHYGRGRRRQSAARVRRTVNHRRTIMGTLDEMNALIRFVINKGIRPKSAPSSHEGRESVVPRDDRRRDARQGRLTS